MTAHSARHPSPRVRHERAPRRRAHPVANLSVIASSASLQSISNAASLLIDCLSVVFHLSSAAAEPRSRRVCRGRRGGAPVPASGSLGRLRRGALPFRLASRGQHRNPEIPKKGAGGFTLHFPPTHGQEDDMRNSESNAREDGLASSAVVGGDGRRVSEITADTGGGAPLGDTPNTDPGRRTT